MKYIYIFIIIPLVINSQTISLNESHIENYIRTMQLAGKLKTKTSLTIRPISSTIIKDEDDFFKKNYSYSLLNFNDKIELKLLPIDYNIEYNEKHPYNRNNGSMIPNSGYQHILSAGFFIKLGPISLQLKPEHLYAENNDYDGFWEGHYEEIWAERYSTWNNIDMPERFGYNSHSKFLFGQSNIKLNFRSLSIGFSNENIWWGPSQRNGIMMSNNARGFRHITFNTIKPIKTFAGNFEWQIISGRLEPSGYTPPNIDKTYNGVKLYIPKENEIREVDWRYFQGMILVYSPKWVNGLHLGAIRWAQMYSALADGRYSWLGKSNYFPIFTNLFRKNDLNSDIQEQIDQGAGVFFRWVWEKEKTEIYAEYNYDDSKLNLRDLLLDDDSARGSTMGIKKIIENSKNIYEIAWEWTKMEQSGSRLLRGGGSWYRHAFVRHGYTNKGEILGASIGPGSNSHYLSIKKLNDKSQIGLALEIVENDNDFYYAAFQDARDFRRYWKDFNLHLTFTKRYKNFWLSSRLAYLRSLNYQWELEDFANDYYHPGRDISNFHLSINLSYFVK